MTQLVPATGLARTRPRTAFRARYIFCLLCRPGHSGRLFFRRVLPAALLGAVTILGGCASGPPPPPYPAFVQTDLIPDQFLASLPGIRAKQFGGDPQTRSMRARIDLPPDWRGTTGGSPGKSLELFVLAGELSLADISLRAGGYAYIPPGSLGFNLASESGARLLYLLDDVDPAALIRTPVILDTELVDWRPDGQTGQATKELRNDPGSGERTWLLRIAPRTGLPWESSTTAREGFLLRGEHRHVECVAGEPYVDTYLPGGYFDRPAAAVNGGPEAAIVLESVWFMRESDPGTSVAETGCSSGPD